MNPHSRWHRFSSAGTSTKLQDGDLEKMAIEISVIIPTFNRAAMVCDCVASVLGQKGVSLEVIVVDNCSPDGPLPITGLLHFATAVPVSHGPT